MKADFTEPTNSLLNPIAASAGQTLSDIWDLVFGNFHYFVEKKRLERETNFIEFKSLLENNLTSIPPENMQEPDISIVGPALEASKFYFEKSELREMFAKLIANSMDDRKASNIHPCFTEIIKQLSSYDAKLLLYIKEKLILPVCNILENASDEDRGFKASNARQNVFASEEFPDIIQNQISITSLQRVSLIEVNANLHIVDDTAYNDIRIISGIAYAAHNKFTLYKMSLAITPLGAAFIGVCL